MVTFIIGNEILRSNHIRFCYKTEKVIRLDAEFLSPSNILSDISTPSLFAEPLFFIIDNSNSLSISEIRILLDAITKYNLDCIFSADTLSPSLQKLLKESSIKVINLSSLTGKDVSETIDNLLKQYNVKLSIKNRRFLLERTAHDPSRFISVLSQCNLGALSEPTLEQISILVGSSEAPGVPWALSDYIENGDVSAALYLCDKAVPLATLAYLSNRYQLLLRIIEADQAESNNESKNANNSLTNKQLIRLSKRVNTKQVLLLLECLSDGDMLCKKYNRDGLRITVGKLTAILSSNNESLKPKTLTNYK